MNRRSLLGLLAALPALSSVVARASEATKATEVQVYKNPSCGCCSAWVDHLQAAGFTTRVTDTPDTAAVRKRLGMPDRLAGCHTAVVGGYVIEGHVPVADIQRLLATRPKAIGLAVPGMPAGSPGMESGTRQDPFKVLLVRREGGETVFASYPA